MNQVSDRTRLSIAIRAVTVWLVLICAEILHGIARGVFLVPHVGEFRSSQIGVFTGSLIILIVALVFVRWIGPSKTSGLLGVGVLWLGLTLSFEFVRPFRGWGLVGAAGCRLQPAGRRAAADRDADPDVVAADCGQTAWIPSVAKVDIFGCRLAQFSREHALTPDDFEMLVVAEKGV